MWNGTLLLYGAQPDLWSRNSREGVRDCSAIGEIVLKWSTSKAMTPFWLPLTFFLLFKQDKCFIIYNDIFVWWENKSNYLVMFLTLIKTSPKFWQMDLQSWYKGNKTLMLELLFNAKSWRKSKLSSFNCFGNKGSTRLEFFLIYMHVRILNNFQISLMCLKKILDGQIAPKAEEDQISLLHMNKVTML